MGRDTLVASAAYQPEPTAAAAARHFVRDTLQGWLMPGGCAGRHELVDDAVLLTSELVTNAVVHAGTPVQVTCRLAGTSVEVMVSDGHPGRLVPETADAERGPAERTSGWGLLLPASLAPEWGVSYGRSAKAVWFRLPLAGPGGVLGSVAADGNGAGLYEELEAVTSTRTALSAALQTVAGTTAGQAGPGDPSYRVLLTTTVEAARVTVRADAAFAFMADEDGDLRLQAATGTMPCAADTGAGGTAHSGGLPADTVWVSAGVAPSLVTVPFVVHGRVTGLLAAASDTPGRFNETQTARLQRLADTWGGPLQRAWLFELDNLRRRRIAVVTAATDLLSCGPGEEDVLALAGRAVVPGLAPWCAVLTWSADGGLRTAYARHGDSSRTAALTLLLDRMCGVAWAAAAGLAQGRGRGSRWPVSMPCAAVVPADADEYAEAEEFATDVAWGFPLAPGGSAGVLVIGRGREERLPREVAALASDVAFRIGAALGGTRPA